MVIESKGIVMESVPLELEAKDTVSDHSFEEFYGNNFNKLLKTAFFMTLSEEVAEDIVQESFAKAYLKWNKVEFPFSYVEKAVVNGCKSWHRHNNVERKNVEYAFRDTTDVPDELFDILLSLSKKQRIAIVLRYYQGSSDEEIARILSLRRSSVPSLISRALSAMKEKLQINEET